MSSREQQNVAFECIKEIAKGIGNVEKRLQRDVSAVCKLVLEPMAAEANQEHVLEKIRTRLIRIYWSLKLHVVFHFGYEAFQSPETLVGVTNDVQKVGGLVGLASEQLNELPQQHHAIDPGSELLEIAGDLAEASVVLRNSEEHAHNVMEIAKSLFAPLTSNNIFKPKVLAIVSHNGQYFVGSSMAVSPFLRPHCLHNRISGFNQNLIRAIMHGKPLDAPDQQSWSSSAFSATNSFTDHKDPCGNCRKTFENLPGFITPVQDRVDRQTFFGACAEYCPVDKLLPHSTTNVSDEVRVVLTGHQVLCSQLFTEYEDIAYLCVTAYEDWVQAVHMLENTNSEERTEAYRILEEENTNIKGLYEQIRSKVRIFGMKPECRI